MRGAFSCMLEWDSAQWSFLILEGILCKVRLSHPIGKRDAIRCDALHRISTSEIQNHSVSNIPMTSIPMISGDLSPLTQCYKVSRFPPTKQVRSRTLQQLCTFQTDKKLPPCPRHSTKANQIIASKMAGTWGKFGEDEGGLEGEGTPSE